MTTIPTNDSELFALMRQELSPPWLVTCSMPRGARGFLPPEIRGN